MNMQVTEEIVRVSLYAHGNDATGYLSTGEALAAALILNRADWLEQMNYTIVGALARIGETWAAALPNAEQIVRKEIEQQERSLHEG